MARYETDVVIPADRVIIVHLPDDMPTGLATVCVQTGDDSRADPEPSAFDIEHQDIEWWEETRSFEEPPIEN